MKVKLSLDKKTIREFFVLHIEKVVLAGVGVCFVLIVYRALGGDSFDQTADELITAATRAEQHWQQSTDVAAVVKSVRAPDYPVRSESINAEPYGCPCPWDRPLCVKRSKRGEPPLFTVDRLRGIAGMGAFRMKTAAGRPARESAPPGGGEKQPQPTADTAEGTRGQRFVVLTGLVPGKKQSDAYDKYFKDAERPESKSEDLPEYVYYRVERAEVTGRGGTADLKWTRLILSREKKRALQSWAGQENEIVPEKYIDEALVFPLGPRVSPRGINTMGRSGEAGEGAWGEEVAYPPEIPLRASPDSLSPGGSKEELAPEEGLEEAGLDMPDLPPAFASAAPPEAGSSTTVVPGGGGKPEYLLFRFFDFTVEAGKRYRYRVRLVLMNPNYDVPDRYLDDHVLENKQKIEDLARQKEAEGKRREARIIRNRWRGIETAWSDPTEVVFVPRDSRVLAVSVKAPPRPAAEPSGRTMVLKFDMPTGREVFEEFPVTRGKVLNFAGRSFPPAKQTTKPRKKNGDKDPLPRPRQPDAGNSISVDYLTDTLVLDMRGGQRLPGRDGMTAPGEILLLDPGGNLIVRNELDDLAEYQQRTAALESTEPRDQTLSGGGSLGDLEKGSRKRSRRSKKE